MTKLYHLFFKKKELFFITVFLVFGSCTTSRKAAVSTAELKPNIMMADDLGWGAVGFLGSYIRTPNLDKLAEEGIILGQFYTTPIGSPTCAGLMTSRYPVSLGLRRFSIAPWSRFRVDTSEVFLPEMLTKAGYANRAAIGKWGLDHTYKRYLPLYRGFTHFYGCYNRSIGYYNHKRLGELDWHNDSATSYDKEYVTNLIIPETINSIKESSKTV